MFRRRCCQLAVLATTVLVMFAGPASGREHPDPSMPGTAGDATGPTILVPEEFPWQTRDSGVRISTLYGDLRREGPFVLRLEYPGGYRKEAHFHPGDASITVLEGAYSRGYGSRFDESAAIPLVPGTFSVNPAGVSHYEWTENGAVLQVYASGPWKSVYVDGQGRPTNAAEKLLPASELQPPQVRKPGQIEWLPAGPTVKRALLRGDPGAAGSFIQRLQLSPGYRKGMHAHSTMTLVTVLSGNLSVELERTSGASESVTLPAGSFMIIPAGMRHHEWVETRTVVEVHGQGPWLELAAEALP